MKKMDELKLHRLINLQIGELEYWGDDNIQRVPGGWIFDRWKEDKFISSVFVPLPEEGKE